MRQLEYHIPIKLVRTRIEDGKRVDGNGKEYYTRFSIITTRKGFVAVLEWNWQTNHGKIYHTEFSAVVNGWKYSARLNEANLSERQLKWMGSYFINNIYKKHNL